MHTQSAACQRVQERERELWKDADVIFCSMWLSHLVSDVMDWILTCAWSSQLNKDACIMTEMLIWVQRFGTKQLWGDTSIEGRLQHVGEGSRRGTGGFKLCRASQIESGCHSAACLCGTGYTDRQTALGEKKQKGQSCQWIWHISAIYKRSRLSIRKMLRSALHLSCPAGVIVPGLMSTISCVINLFIWPSPIQQICLV